MKSRNFRFALMTGFVGLASFVVTACTDSDTAQETKKNVEDGISFTVSDVQDISLPSLPMTKAASVYETTSTPLEGDGAEGLELVETTIEGVNPVYIPASTRGTLTTKENFVTINKPFYIFACKNGGSTADYLYKEEVKADGTMTNCIKWKKSEANSLKFYAVHPAVSNNNQKITTTSGTNPIVKFSPNDNVQQQTDLLVATTDNFSYDDYVNQKIPIKFSHATTAIQFKIGNDLSYNRQIKSIEINGVIGEGTYDVASKAWTLGTTKKNYTLTFATPFSTAQDKGVIMNGGDGLFFMIPQTIPADATVKITFDNNNYVVAKIGGNNKAWVAGTTKTYMISNSSDLSDRDFILSVTPKETTKEYNETDVAYTVQSYRRPKNYPTEKNDRNIEEPWTITGYEYSDDNGKTWTTMTTTKPAMVKSLKEGGNGSTSGEAATMTLTNDYHDFKAERDQALKDAPLVNDKDLSLVNGKQSTANCYIVSAGGTYKFPTVYGNAIENGKYNTGAYTSKYQQSKVTLNPFWGTKKIADPYIDGTLKAELLWCSVPNLVTNVKVANKFVTFTVAKDKIQEGSAIIAVKEGNTIRWSWHIWFTSQDVMNTDNFMREPLGFRHTKWNGTSYLENRKVRVTITQTRSKKKAELVVTQKAAPYVREGVAMYYQQGRKDPLTPNALNENNESVMYLQAPGSGKDTGLRLSESVKRPLEMARFRWYDPDAQRNIGSKGNGDWMWLDFTKNGKPGNSAHEPSYSDAQNGTYYNLWDADRCRAEAEYDFKKTVYDPSPAGFHVPRFADFELIKETNAGKGTFMPGLGILSHYNFEIKEVGTGYYWSCDKKEGPGYLSANMQWHGIYGLIAKGTVSNHKTTLVLKRPEYPSWPMFKDMAWGANIISVKEK